MAEVNTTLEAHEQIAKIVVAKDAWTIDNHIMTPTMKVKRNEVEKRYMALLEKHADDYKTKVVWE
jgi:long-chain acyl-CoA synthetase